jgi:Flp pilus assembly protein TadG
VFIRLRQLLRRGRGQEGAAALEFAALLPVLVLLLAGFFDFGWYFYWQHTVTNASREGVRYGVQANYPGGIYTPHTDAEIQKIVKDNYGSDLGVTVVRTANTPGQPLSVEVEKTMKWFFLDYLRSKGVNLPIPKNATTMTLE